MKRQWLFASNTFEVQTRRSQVKALKMFKDFCAKLRASAASDADIATQLALFAPIFEAYEKLYAQRDLISGSYKGHTLNFEQEIAKLPEQLRIWEGKVHNFYPEDSFVDTILFPRRRTPFLQGSYEDRISTVLTLSIALNDYPDLSTLQAMVQSYHNVLSTARDVQQQKEGLNDILSSRLEEQRILTAQEMFGCYGLLVFKYRHTPERILDFIDTELLRYAQSNQDVVMFKGKVTTLSGVPIANATVLIPEIGLEATTNDKGDFELEVETGLWRIEVRADGYQTHLHTDTSFDSNTKINFTLAEN